MLRAWQQAQTKLQSAAMLNFMSSRSFAAMTWPAEVPKPAGVKPFDPSGPLSQIDALAEGLDPENPYVKAVVDLKELKGAVDKLKLESTAGDDAKPPGLATLSDGSIDEQFYIKTQGIHPSFVKEFKATMEAEAKSHPVPKQSTAWAETMKKLQPEFEAEHGRLMKELLELRATEKQLADFEERLEEITVDEMLEKYPKLAQEIKEEIEAGVWEPTDAGYKIPADALAK